MGVIGIMIIGIKIIGVKITAMKIIPMHLISFQASHDHPNVGVSFVKRILHS